MKLFGPKINLQAPPNLSAGNLEAWVNFKVWGILSLTFVFTAFQIPLINKYKNE